jgi:hypothetical protein
LIGVIATAPRAHHLPVARRNGTALHALEHIPDVNVLFTDVGSPRSLMSQESAASLCLQRSDLSNIALYARVSGTVPASVSWLVGQQEQHSEKQRKSAAA